MDLPGAPDDNPMQWLLGDLLKFLGGGAPDRWEMARSLAFSVATGGTTEANVEPAERIRVEELARIAELHVQDVTGLPLAPDGHQLAATPVRAGAFALAAIDAWKPLLAALLDATSQPAPPPRGTGTPPAPGIAGRTEPGLPDDLGTLPVPPGTAGPIEPGGLGGLGGSLSGLPFGEEGDRGVEGIAGLLGQWATVIGPMLGGLQIGSTIGHLAQHALGQYVLPVPWSGTPGQLLFVPDNIARYASDWSIPVDEATLWVCLHELTMHAVLGRAHVRARLEGLLDAASQTTAGLQQDLAASLGAIDPTDPEAFERLLGHPETLLEGMMTPERRQGSEQLSSLVSVVVSYADWACGVAAGRVIGSPGAVQEAWRRRRRQPDQAEQAGQALFGLDLDPARLDRGTAFVQGVLERAGEDGLARLWSSARTLPTPAEVDAPGLWLERIDLPLPDDLPPPGDQDGGGGRGEDGG